MFKIIIALLDLLLSFICSFGVTCGVIWLICMIFNLTFSWFVSIGIWVVLMLIAMYRYKDK